MSWIADIAREIAEHGAIVRVTVIRADGSTPRETGAAMLVGAGHIRDTIGGGALELEAIAHARGLIANAAATPPPASKASPSMQRGGRMERHGLGSPVATLNTTADRRAKSDGVPGGGDGLHLRQTPPPDAPNALAPQNATRLQGRRKEAALTRGASSSPLVCAEGGPSAQTRGEETQSAAPHPSPLPIMQEACLRHDEGWGEGTRAASDAPPWQRDVRDFALGPSLGQCCGGYTRLLFELFTARERPTLEALATGVDPSATLSLRPLDSGGPLEVVSTRKEPGERPLAVTRALRDMLSGARPREAILIRGAKGDSAWFLELLARRTVPLFIYGAGHVGRALVRVLQDLPFAITWVDTAPARFPDPLPSHARAQAAPDLPALASAAPVGAYHIVMTYSHALDLAICHAVLRRGDFGHLGLIGSATKRARFLKRLAELGISPAMLSRLTCPIGVPGLDGKEPSTIAISVAAQLAQLATAGREEAAGNTLAAEDGRR